MAEKWEFPEKGFVKVNVQAVTLNGVLLNENDSGMGIGIRDDTERIVKMVSGAIRNHTVQVGHWSKDCPAKKAKKAVVGAQANTVLGTTDGPKVNMVVGEVVASGTNDRVME
ncbi:hypothetical protein POM88_037092 [Heracleum sosnowskyi]|uniref:Uncharacterized protein n=1 Tax=Heracleum sosnowskyi TaxID=360622 RepID=A0AAD8HPH6_9APIA|nr:hypothetical protein POM88_037092 [Heracleum sosnowskyi]